jgi:peptidoglycan/xylan/chitin deacetylase (PgdA/CDA1 family)
VGSRLLVLGWHNVEPTWFFPARPGTGAAGLNRQLAFLRRTATVVPLADGVRALAEGRPLPPRAVALTFDDGYRDALRLAAPILERLGLPATFFLIPGLLDRTTRPWWELVAWACARAGAGRVAFEGRRLDLGTPAARRTAAVTVAELVKRRGRAARDTAVAKLMADCQPTGAPGVDGLFLDWDEAGRLAARGFAVGSHTLHHSILAEEPPAEQASDLALSCRQLQDRLGVAVELLAYPNGTPADYDRTTVAAARRAGYLGAVTVVPGWNRPATPRYELRRFLQQPERGVAGLAVVPAEPVRRRLRTRRPLAWTGYPHGSR